MICYTLVYHGYRFLKQRLKPHVLASRRAYGLHPKGHLSSYGDKPEHGGTVDCCPKGLAPKVASLLTVDFRAGVLVNALNCAVIFTKNNHDSFKYQLQIIL